jgi:hypothetical protein
MRKSYIEEKLADLGMSRDDFVLGDFDSIGEFTAKKCRDPQSDLYRTVGAFFRPNYERGILITALIRKYGIRSMLEIGFGRGYATFCAAKAMAESGESWRIVTIDPNLNEQFLQQLSQVLPRELFAGIEFRRGTSQSQIPQLGDEKFGLVYIDGDHTEAAVQSDWELTRDRYEYCLLFDDYHLSSKDSGPGIQVASVVDRIDDPSKELIITDRLIFNDDRRISREDKDYGQVLLTKDKA